MFEELREHSLAFVIIKDWIPSLITIFVGGVVATLLLPRLAAGYAARRALADKRLEFAGRVAVAFRRYVMAWRRLITFAEPEEKMRPLPKGSEDRRRAYAEQRNQHKDELIEALCFAKTIFSSTVAKSIDSFIDWDEAQAGLSLDNLPKLERWVKWEKDITDLINHESKQSS